MLVILGEPLADLAVLAAAKTLAPLTRNLAFENRLHNAA
ncbi:MAG: cobalt transporter, partial [Pseudomonadota bacterium]|nr:cobalt transporter [Pseudomonadota bacterium]